MVDMLRGEVITFPTPDVTVGIFKRDRTKKDPLPRNKKTGEVVHTLGRISHIYNIELRLNRIDPTLYIFNSNSNLRRALNTLLKKTNIEYPYNPWQSTDL